MASKTPFVPAIETTATVGVFLVESQYVAPGQMYVTDIYEQTCTCPAGQAGRYCKHQRAAEAFHDARVLAERAAAARAA